MKRKDYTGKRYGMVEVIRFSHTKNNAMWLCRCRCGYKWCVPSKVLRKGKLKHCGCLRKYSCRGIEPAIKRDFSPLLPTYYHEKQRLAQEGHKLHMTPAQAWKLLLKQCFLCCNSGRLLTLDRALLQHTGNAALQRLDQRKRYTFNNCNWVRKLTLQD